MTGLGFPCKSGLSKLRLPLKLQKLDVGEGNIHRDANMGWLQKMLNLVICLFALGNLSHLKYRV